MSILLFPVLVACSVGASIYLKNRLFRENTNAAGYLFFFIFDGVFVVPYLDIAKNGDFLFLGNRPDILTEHPYIGLLALIGALLHVFAFPAITLIKHWFFLIRPSSKGIVSAQKARRDKYNRRVLAKWERRPKKNLTAYMVATFFSILFWIQVLKDWLESHDVEFTAVTDGAVSTDRAVTYVFFALLALVFYLPSLWARFALSAERFSPFRLAIVYAYNILCGIFHQRFMEVGSFPILGSIENSAIGWLSFIMVIAHAEALPYPWRRRVLFWKIT